MPMYRSLRGWAAIVVVTIVSIARADEPVERPALQNPPAAPPPPFQLAPPQQQFVDQVLNTWEQSSTNVKTFKCTFEHFQYIVAIAGRDIPLHVNRGELSYQRPDKGSFKVDQVGTWNNNRQKPDWPIDKNAVGEHYVCDGQKVYVYNHRAKQLEISPIPADLQGQQIVDGPLPFLFGAKAQKLKERYWIQPTKSDEKEIWLDARPKFAADAANYRQVEVILDRKELLPRAIKVYRPNGDEDVYLFALEDAKVNDPLAQFFGVFARPKVPWGWDVIEHPEPQGPAQPPAGQREHQARRSNSSGPARY
jgi:TIGR03009 family protein